MSVGFLRSKIPLLAADRDGSIVLLVNLVNIGLRFCNTDDLGGSCV